MTRPLEETRRAALADEAWATIPSIPTHEASTHGRIRVAATGELVEPYLHRTGYIYIFLITPKGRQPPKQVHRLVLEAHRGPCPEGFEALHLNDTPTCNLLSNLIWNTKKVNGRTRRTERHRIDRRRRWDERLNLDRASLCKAYSDGATLTAVAKTYRTTRETVKRILMEQGVEIRTGHGNTRRFDHDTIVALHIIGKTQREIAKAVGCKQAAVSYALRRANVSPGSSYIDRDRIKAFHIEGLGPFMIAKRVGCSADSVSRILEELAVAGEIAYQKREARPAYGHTPERDARIVQDFKTGQHSDDIAKAHGVTAAYVLQQARKAGLKVKGGRLRTSYGSDYCRAYYQAKKCTAPSEARA
ncbi:HNH endonuclease signature motif containing protein [Rhizobium ruizarguesonis]|uniref:HNH endonuclease signature motif containing protein n=1 Tax=Rhizobium ruizarguesonis TaxID=2081791 RepID=UPI0010314375|nr:HNH endonuclease signature motif containing protein [Rhizobium ruizarguesonis]TAW18879.1 HNH endonuclease [Rhizobium ruizarguesonis]TAZ54556.1 HNH endonuclease [Rhizobium ruizarguesonis]